MAKKPKNEGEAPETPAAPIEITAEQVAAKRKESGYVLSEAQARAVLQSQAEHDATNPHDPVPKEEVI